MKRILSVLLILAFMVVLFVSCDSTKKEVEFHDIVLETQDLLDVVADDIYSYWYDCIYEDKYSDDINIAIATAIVDNQNNIDKIKLNNEIIKGLYAEVKDGALKSEVKEVMQAYNDYYSLVIEVSGSFKSFSADKETLKKELSSALKNLSFEF